MSNALPFSGVGAAKPAPRFYTMPSGDHIRCNGFMGSSWAGESSVLEIHHEGSRDEGEGMRDADALSVPCAVLENLSGDFRVDTMAHEEVMPVTNPTLQGIAPQVRGTQREGHEVEKTDTEDDLTDKDDGFVFR